MCTKDGTASKTKICVLDNTIRGDGTANRGRGMKKRRRRRRRRRKKKKKKKKKKKVYFQ